MLVQLSPWETSRTSLRLTSEVGSKRRRTPKGSSQDDDGDQTSPWAENPPVVASFISTASKRVLSRMKAHSSEFNGCLPLLTITTEHHITVIGKNILDQGSSSIDDSDAVVSTSPKPSPYREFSVLRYNSRPGKATSFFPKSSAPGKGLPNIPAILDTKNDVVYAFQLDNHRLCCWNLWEGSGPDDKNALKVDLDSPALCMSLLPMFKGMVYGTCLNGNLFVAKVIGAAATKDLQLDVEYLSFRQSKEAMHIGTCAEIPVAGKTRTVGRKRKMSDAEGNASVKFYQFFHDDTTIQAVCHDASIASTSSEVGLKKDDHVQRVATVVNVASRGDTLRIRNAELLVSASCTIPAAALVYSVFDGRGLTTSTFGYGSSSERNQRHDEGTFCASLSLGTASFATHPLRVCPASKQYGLVSDTILSCASESLLSLYDLRSGACLQKRSLPASGGDFLVKCDTKTATIAVLQKHEPESVVSLTAASLSNTGTHTAVIQLKASSALMGSLLASKVGVMRREDATRIERHENAVEKSLVMLKECREKYLSGTNPVKAFNQVFDDCLLDLDKTYDDISRANLPNTPHNPQDPSNSSREGLSKTKCLMNGFSKKVFDSSTNSKEIMRSSRNRPRHHENFGSLPQAFIDGSVQIVLDAIRSPGKDKGKLSVDARSVLGRLLRTGRVSARLHFEGSFSLQETTKKHPLYTLLRQMQRPIDGNPLTAMQLVVELLQNCRDVSERQLVIMMDYMLRIPKADDIAQAFADTTAIEMTQKLRRDSRSYICIRGMKGVEKHHSEISEEAGAEIGRRLVVAGAELVLHMILCYSECNGIMLRIALAEVLNTPAEVIVMAQLLSRMLKSSPSNVPSMHRKNPNFVRTTCQWIASLCESFEDELKEAKTPFGTDYLTHLLNAVQSATRNSQAIISFKDGIGIAESVKKERLQRADIHGAETNIWQTEEDLPGYSIDRFLF
jgi:hypothetical protein